MINEKTLEIWLVPPEILAKNLMKFGFVNSLLGNILGPAFQQVTRLNGTLNPVY